VIEIAARIGVDEVYLQRMVFSAIGLAVEEQSIYRATAKRPSESSTRPNTWRPDLV